MSLIETLRKLKESRNLNQQKTFYESIKSGDYQAVRNYVKDRPYSTLKIIFNGEHAVTTALESKCFEIYSYLKFHGFPDGDASKILQKLTENEKEEIGNHNRRLSKYPEESHLNFILSVVKLSKTTTNEGDRSKYEAIKKLIYELDAIESLRPLLKAVKIFGGLKITFDLDRDDVSCILPTTDAEGLTVASRGEVFIAAEGAFTEEEVFIFNDPCRAMGTFIHEITHFVMEALYENKAKPYYASNFESKEKFGKIVREIEELYNNYESTDDIVKNVFEQYDQDKWESELIVTAPELIAKYSGDEHKLRRVQMYTQSLFTFFKEHVMKDVEKFDESMFEIRRANNAVKTYRKLIEHKITDRSNFTTTSEPIQIIGSNAPTFSMALILQKLNNLYFLQPNTKALFAEFDSFEEEEALLTVRNALLSSNTSSLILNCAGKSDKDVEDLVSFLKESLMTKRIVLITDGRCAIELKQKKSQLNIRWLIHQFCRLENSTQENLLKKKINFQCESVKLHRIISSTSLACQFLPLQEVIDGRLQIDGPVTISYNGFFVNRTFQVSLNQGKRKRSSTLQEIGYDELLKNGEKVRKILISDIAGTGKSVILERIALKLKQCHNDRWVALIDLKIYTNALKAIKNSYRSYSFLDFMQNVFNRGAVDLDREILKELYEKGRSIIVLDSFDEISPYYKEIVKILITKFDTKLGNELWVATRSHLEEELQPNGFTIVRLKELTRVDQVNFLMRSWDTTAPGAQIKAESLIEQLQILISSESGYIGYPQLIKMIAEIYKDQELQEGKKLSFFSIYDAFWRKHLENWNTVSEVAQMERTELELNPDAQKCVHVHQNLAVQSIFGDTFGESEVEIDEAWTDEMILRVRIVKNRKTFSFIHETFAEYFVASLLLNSLKKNKIDGRDLDLFKQIILGRGHEIIRKFLNEKVPHVKISENYRKNLRLLVKTLKASECQQFMFYVAKEGLSEFFDLFSLHEQEIGVVQNLFRASQFNPVHHAFSSNQMSFLHPLIKTLNILSREEQREKLSVLPKIRKSIFHGMMENPYEQDPSVPAYLEEIFKPPEIRDMLLLEQTREKNILENAIKYEKLGNLLLRNAFDFLKKYLTLEEIKSMIFKERQDFGDCIRLAAEFGNRFSIDALFKIVEEVYEHENEEIKQMLMSNSKPCQHEIDNSLLFINIKSNKNKCSFEALYRNISKFLDRNEISKLLKSGEDHFVIQLLLKSRSVEEDLDKFSMWISVDAMKNIIKTCLYGSIKQGSETHVELFWNKCRELFHDEEFKAILKKTITDPPYGNILHHSADYSEGVLFPLVEAHVSEVFEPHEITQLLKQLDGMQPTKSSAVYKVILKSHEDILEENLNILKKYFYNDELAELMTFCNKGEDHVMTHYMQLKFNNQIRKFFEFSRKVFGREMCRNLFSAKNNAGDNVFHAAAENKDPRAFSTVFKCIEDLFVEQEIKEFLTSRNNWNESVLHLALTSQKDPIKLKEIVAIFEQEFSVEEICYDLSLASTDSKLTGIQLIMKKEADVAFEKYGDEIRKLCS